LNEIGLSRNRSKSHPRHSCPRTLDKKWAVQFGIKSTTSTIRDLSFNCLFLYQVKIVDKPKHKKMAPKTIYYHGDPFTAFTMSCEIAEGFQAGDEVKIISKPFLRYMHCQVLRVIDHGNGRGTLDLI